MKKDTLVEMVKEIETSGYKSSIKKFYKEIPLFRYFIQMWILTIELVVVDSILMSANILPSWFNLHYIPEICIFYMLGLALVKLLTGLRQQISGLLFAIGGAWLVYVIFKPMFLIQVTIFCLVAVVAFIKEKLVSKEVKG